MHGDKVDRREDRVLSYDPAVMILENGDKITGFIGNMSLGGMLFVAADEGAPLLEQGILVEIRITLYGRVSHFNCTLAHQQAHRFGLKLCRV